MPKKIKVDCFGPIAANKKYTSIWEDVWLSWTGKPGRTKYEIAPTLISKTDAERNLAELIHLKKEGVNGAVWDEEINAMQIAVDTIHAGKIHIDDTFEDIPNVYTPKEFIDREEAEKMIAVLMKQHGFKEIKCKWSRPKYIVIPT